MVEHLWCPTLRASLTSPLRFQLMRHFSERPPQAPCVAPGSATHTPELPAPSESSPVLHGCLCVHLPRENACSLGAGGFFGLVPAVCQRPAQCLTEPRLQHMFSDGHSWEAYVSCPFCRCETEKSACQSPTGRAASRLTPKLRSG